MATYTVAAGAIGTAEWTLTPGTVDVVTFGDNLGFVDIISDGAAAIWYTADGTTPTVGGANCWYLPAVPCVETAGVVNTDIDTIRLISAGSPKLRVQKR